MNHIPYFQLAFVSEPGRFLRIELCKLNGAELPRPG